MNQHVAIEADPLIRYGIHTNDEWASFVLLRIFKELPYKPHAELDCEAYETLVRKNLQGYVLVIDPKFDLSAQYKLPSGKKSKVQDNEYQPDETPLCTAIRELHGETGVRLPANRFTFIGKTLAKTRHGDHWKCLFTANGLIDDRDWMNDVHAQNEGEIPKFFSSEEFHQLVKRLGFFAPHEEMLCQYGLLI